MMIRLLAIALCGLVWTVGCSGGAAPKNRQKTFPSSGSVKLNGKPVEGATVVFAPEATGDAAVSASAMTDVNGAFSLQAYPPLKGAAPGKYKVSITKREVPPSPPDGPNAHDVPQQPPPKWIVPEKFSDPAKSGLTADIPEGGRDDLHFELP
ncbi:MAG TPA: carboxypeptidase-like regulatory domain-containing protein [Planctomycetaceae bacterium]|nr:carboxypeptidase-like regulatory domain-containing protein [Planctomycetaceae bacterium]